MISSLRQFFEHILNAVAQHIKQWVKPNKPSLFADAASDLMRSKAELVLENSVLRQQLIVLNRQVKRPALKPHEHVLETGSDHRATGYTSALASRFVSLVMEAQIPKEETTWSPTNL